MSSPFDVGVIDLMVTVPSQDAWQQTFAGLVRDEASAELAHPAGYLFVERPDVGKSDDFLVSLLREMDRWGVERSLLPVDEGDAWGRRAVQTYPHRFSGSLLIDPNRGTGEREKLRRLHAEGLVHAAAVFPAGLRPGVAIDGALLYPVYAVCCELDIPVLVNVGVPGPRFPMSTQHPGALDQVCHDFPELRVVTRHGGEPWEDLLVELMIKWPNLHYSTSAFAPKHYPRAIVDYANTRGRDKVLYAGYFPSGLSLERIFTELPDVPFRDDVWPAFLRNNAQRVFGFP